METFPINYWALLVAAIVKFAIGAVWYAPPVFGTQWQRLVGITPEQMKSGMVKASVVDFVAGLIMAYVLVHAVHYAGAVSAGQGAVVGFFNWLGFVATLTFSAAFFEHRPLRLWLINNAYQLISLVVMGIIVAVWP